MKTFLIIFFALAASAVNAQRTRQGCNHYGRPEYGTGCPAVCPAGQWPQRTTRGCFCVPCTQTFACPTGSVWNPTLCRCTCVPVVCAANFFQSPLANCACICNIAACVNGLPVNPVTCTCPII